MKIDCVSGLNLNKYSEKKGKKNARFMDNAFRNKGTNFFNVGT